MSVFTVCAGPSLRYWAHRIPTVDSLDTLETVNQLLPVACPSGRGLDFEGSEVRPYIPVYVKKGLCVGDSGETDVILGDGTVQKSQC